MKKYFLSTLLITCIHAVSFSQCNNWLNILFEPSYVDVGDISISGTQLTVEAMFNRTERYEAGVGDYNDGDIVSKHTNPDNVNYLLRPNHAYITTTNGFFGTPDVCDAELNKTYYVAMVYDGATLKFYRNGYLVSQVAATGNLIQNSYPTRIGRYSSTTIETFIGYINEVRIWNVAKAQSELKQYMNTSLPNPTTQTGLLAYYEFSTLKNLQGNTSWDGVITGNASINQINPTCAGFEADSCQGALPIVLRDFHGSKSGSQVSLYWSTFGEANLDKIEVERSHDASSFIKIGEVPLKLTSQQNNYQFNDATSDAAKIFYYRLKLVDKNGSVVYSSILSFNLSQSAIRKIQINPNPAVNYFQVAINAEKQQKTVLQMKDLSGKVVLQETVNLNVGYNSHSVYFREHLPSGLYIVQVSVDGKIISKKTLVR